MFSEDDNMEELWSKKFISFYIQVFKFSPSVNVEVKEILFLS